jgi:hypothetical protein
VGDIQPYFMILTIAASAIPLMEENLRLNGLSSGDERDRVAEDTEASEGSGVQVLAKALDWEEPLPDYLTESTWPQLIV